MRTILLVTLLQFLPYGVKNERKLTTSYNYPLLYRDHVYTNLTQKGREMFFAMEIHPSCAKKGGECMQRSKCIEKKMLYISRVCYKRHWVCCYDDTVQNPSVRPY